MVRRQTDPRLVLGTAAERTPSTTGPGGRGHTPPAPRNSMDQAQPMSLLVAVNAGNAASEASHVAVVVCW